jgi:hypothetical protein
VYKGESISICTKQKNKGGEYHLVKSDIKSKSASMTVDYDVVEKGTKLTKKECIKRFTKKNDSNLSGMRWASFILILLGCCCCFIDFAVVFDICTDGLTYIPQLIGETLACGGDCISGRIQELEDSADRMAYTCCTCLGCCVGFTCYYLIFAFCYVNARAGYAWMFYTAIAILCLICTGAGYFSKRMYDKNNEKAEEKRNQMHDPENQQQYPQQMPPNQIPANQNQQFQQQQAPPNQVPAMQNQQIAQETAQQSLPNQLPNTQPPQETAQQQTLRNQLSEAQTQQIPQKTVQQQYPQQNFPKKTDPLKIFL